MVAEVEIIVVQYGIPCAAGDFGTAQRKKINFYGSVKQYCSQQESPFHFLFCGAGGSVSSSKSHSLELMAGSPRVDFPGGGFREEVECDDVLLG